MKIAILLFLFVSTAQAMDATSLLGFISGHYDLIGKSLDSKNTYLGEVTITDGESESELQITRVINGNTIIGKANIEQSGEQINVLRIRFTENDQNYEETCLVNSDLDNYARLTCHLYQPDIRTTEPGLEALFIKHDDD